MATASKIQLSASHRPVFAVSNLTQESADKASELLQENHEKHHSYFNESGFHNHVAHHLLTIYALGASPSDLQAKYDADAAYQLPQRELDEKVVQELHDEETFGQYLGTRNQYVAYLTFFKEEIEKKGWQDVVNEYIFSGTAKAEDMLVRLFGGFLHPLIHLGFGIEFAQPAIIAEALAQTATHDTWMGQFLLPAEKIAGETAGQSSESLIQLMNEARANSKLVKSIRGEDGNKLREGVIGRAGEEMAKLAAKYTVKPEELETRCAEMIEFCSYCTLAAQRPDKEIKIDFFLMHDLNSSIFYPAFLKSPWLSTASKVRLLEWKGRTDLAQYVARGSPDLLLDEITNYSPKKAAAASQANGVANGDAAQHDWAWVFSRACKMSDDGHVAKLVRALAYGHKTCHGSTITDNMWLNMELMTIDSTDGYERRWVRTTGLDVAWEGIPDRARL